MCSKKEKENVRVIVFYIHALHIFNVHVYDFKLKARIIYCTILISIVNLCVYVCIFIKIFRALNSFSPELQYYITIYNDNNNTIILYYYVYKLNM